MERNIMESLSLVNPDLAEQIAQRMFLFDDIVKLDDRAVQRILRDVDMNKDLPLALKGSRDEVWRKVLANVSARAGQALKESVEFLGPVRIRDVEEAQTKIVNLIRSLEERGEIQIVRGGGADEFI
jgi:flagellar motor switch protein FliG